MPTAATLHDKQLKARLRRLMDGASAPDDILKLYVGKRQASFGRASFRELADFAAHPDIRNRGPVADRVRDMRTTFRPMFERLVTDEASPLEQVYARAESNLRMANDEQVGKLSMGRNRKDVEKLLRSALAKMRNGSMASLSQVERMIALNFGDRVVWNPALTAHEVFDDFKYVMTKNGLLSKSEAAGLDAVRSDIVLHAITVMHGCAFDLGDGLTGELKAGFDNAYGNLEVTAVLAWVGHEKPVSMKVGLYWTDLPALQHVGEPLMDRPGPWDFPIEVRSRKLEPLGDMPPPKVAPEGVAVIDFPGGRRTVA